MVPLIKPISQLHHLQLFLPLEDRSQETLSAWSRERLAEEDSQKKSTLFQMLASSQLGHLLWELPLLEHLFLLQLPKELLQVVVVS